MERWLFSLDTYTLCIYKRILENNIGWSDVYSVFHFPHAVYGVTVNAAFSGWPDFKSLKLHIIS